MEGLYKHPDFIVTLDGTDVTKDVNHWRIRDLEQGMSSFTVKLDNTDKKYIGKVSVNSNIAIRFGHFGNLSARIEMDVRKYKPRFSNGGQVMVIVGLDCTYKLSKKTGRGHHKNAKIKENIEQLAKEARIAINAEKLKEPDDQQNQKKDECGRTPMPAGTTGSDHLQGLIDRCDPGQSSSSSGSSVFDSKDDDSGGEKQLLSNAERAMSAMPDKEG